MPYISDYTTTPKNPPKSQKTPEITGPYVKETLLQRGQVQLDRGFADDRQLDRRLVALATDSWR